MPIRRDAAPYPRNWKAFSRAIRERAGNRCECAGECGLHRNAARGGPRRCTERHGEAAQFAKGKVVLTTAHLNAAGGPCRCDPPCADPSHVLAMCNRCHLRYDVKLHVANGRATRRRKAREAGQLEIVTLTTGADALAALRAAAPSFAAPGRLEEIVREDEA